MDYLHMDAAYMKNFSRGIDVSKELNNILEACEQASRGMNSSIGHMIYNEEEETFSQEDIEFVCKILKSKGFSVKMDTISYGNEWYLFIKWD